jgi:hypothetical protein
VNLLTTARFRFKSFDVVNQATYNLLGGFNQWSERTDLNFKKNDLKAKVSLLLKNSAPDPFQRRYSSNNFQYSLPNIEKQLFLRIAGDVNWKLKDSVLDVGLKADFSSITSTYLFDGVSWFQSDKDFVFSSITAKANIKLGRLHFYPTVIYSFDNEGYLPVFQSYSRLFLKGRLFKAKRLQALIGVDVSYISSFNTRVYIPALDVMDFSSAGNETEGIFNVHAFASFGIQEFRFFVRYENIGYFWNSTVLEEQRGYPIAGTRVRIGVSWDFIN